MNNFNHPLRKQEFDYKRRHALIELAPVIITSGDKFEWIVPQVAITKTCKS